MQNKARAGDERKRPWKKSGLSMEYKSASKSFSASFKKAESYDEDDDQSEKDVAMNENDVEEILQKVNVDQPYSKDSVNNKSMESLKNTTSKGVVKVADISAKSHWMKDKVANLWSRKNRGDVNERSDCQCESEMTMNETEATEKFDLDDLIGRNDGSQSGSPVDHSLVVNPQEDQFDSSFEQGSDEIKGEDKKIKDKKEVKAKTGWIRDQVSNLISKGRSYTAGAVVQQDKEGNSNEEEKKSTETSVVTDNTKSQDLSLSMMEHYNLKQKETETPDDNWPVSESISFKPLGSPKAGEVSNGKDKFVDIHESISKKILYQTALTPGKESLQNNSTKERPISPKQPIISTPLSKPISRKSKIKDFLNTRPPTTDLTHLPPPVSDGKTEKDKPDNSPSLRNQAKKKFKFATKLSFSELLRSQEVGQISPEEEFKVDNTERLLESPICNRIEEEASSDEENHTEIQSRESNYESSVNYSSSVTYFKLWNLAVMLYAYSILPTPSFINGLVLGALITYLSGCLVVWLFCPSGKSIEQYKLELKNYIKEQDLTTPVRKLNKRSMDPKALQKPRDLKGWLHFLLDYEPRLFTLDSTKDVFAIVRGEVMHILFCKSPPEINATPQKMKKMKRGLRRKRNKKTTQLQNQEPIFVFVKEHKIFLSSSHIDLCPLDLPMRRIWNRKYPIRIDVPANEMLTREIDVPFEELTSNFEEFFCSSDAVWSKSTSEERFYVFPNTSREKEDWFYRMQLCVKPLKHQVTFQNIKKGSLSTLPIESYPHYMTECIRESEKVTSRVINGKKLEPHSAWLNVLIGRAFWDVWHEQYWKRKVWQKIQNRLSKLNTPPIIKEIFVKDLQLGHTLPIIHRGTLPELDEYGVWTDLQVTYQGEFTLTLETQLNVDYYVNLLTIIAKKQTHASEGHSSSDGVRMKVVREKNDEESADNLTDSSCDASIAGGDATDFETADILDEQLPEIFLEAMDNVPVDEEDLGAALDDDPMISDPRTKAFLESKTGKRVIGVVGWLARSKIAKKVAGTDFAKRAYEKAYEKFRKMPITLKVTVQNLKGTLAVNIPPPPSNRLWFGFRGNPALLITAHPKLGDRHVRLTYLTDWIEKKLKEEFTKLFVLPSMQDLSVKLMYSRLEELYPERPLS